MKKNVFLIGFAKCGTTLLASQLCKNKFVYSKFGKEPCFFDYRYKGLENLSRDNPLFKKYLNSFPGNKTVDALPWKISRICAQKIKELFPDAYIIICIRDKLERAISHFHHLHRATGIKIKDLVAKADQLEDLDERLFDDSYLLGNLYAPMPRNIFISDYGKVIDDYNSFFDKERVFIFDIDRDNDSKKISKDLSKFLNEDIEIDLNEKINSKGNQLDPSFLNFLRKIDFFLLINKIPANIKEKIKEKMIFFKKKNVTLTSEEIKSISMVLNNVKK